MKVTRRDALKGAGVIGVAAAIGCDGPDDAPLDGGADAQVGDDASMPDGGPIGRDGGPAPTGPFRHGVASGDPLPDSVILWTRVTLDGAPASATVEWEMATDPAFTTIEALGMATTDADADWTVKVDAPGLVAATTYYYRFKLMGTADVSPIGRTRTAPAATDAATRLRFAVCSCSSFAHGYFHAYRNIAQRADLDLVIHLGDYIYEYGTGEYGNQREVDPPHEILTLEDYRRRYALYRSDPDVREVHRQHPFVNVWDDHETANNSWLDGAENHDEGGEGTWAARKAAAQQAFSEWLPIRTTDPTRIWRRLQFGTLADLVMLDTRIEGRTEQGQGAPETRTLLSTEQEAFLFDALETSPARWKLIGQQVVVSPVPVIFNSDAWDGYPAQRQRLIDTIRTGGGKGSRIEDVIVLTGDIHMSFAVEVPVDPEAMPLPPPVAVEIVAPGITSPALAPGPLVDGLVRQIEMDLPYAKHYDLVHRGYVVLDLSATHAQADFVTIDDVTAPYDASETPSASWRTATGTSVLEETTALAPAASPPELAP